MLLFETSISAEGLDRRLDQEGSNSNNFESKIFAKELDISSG